MIINHTYKFIFIKTRKTAGTSIEIALSQFCGPDDVITPIAPEDEAIRRELGWTGPQNYRVPLRSYRLADWAGLVLKQRRKVFHNHAPASFIQENVDREIWDSYYKFCFERDPFDKAISHYYWSTTEPRPDINEFLMATPARQLTNWARYTIADQVVVDFVGRFEDLAGDLAVVAQKVGLPGKIIPPKAKGGYRSDRQHYSRVLDARTRARIEAICARELDTFHYQWKDAGVG